MSKMLVDLQLYCHLVAMQLRAQMQYKVNVLIDIITYLCVTSLEFVALLIFLVLSLLYRAGMLVRFLCSML